MNDMGQLQHKKRMLRKVKLNNGGGATIEWQDMYFDAESASYVKTSDGRTSDALAHDDLKAAVGLFIEHLAIAAEEVAEPKVNYPFDQSIKGLEKYAVSSVTLRGGDSDPDGMEEPKPVQVFIFGNKRLKPGYKKNFGTYGIKLASPQEPYKFAVALEQHVAELEAEAWAYLDGKHAPPAQTALNLDAHDDADGEEVKLLEAGA